MVRNCGHLSVDSQSDVTKVESMIQLDTEHRTRGMNYDVIETLLQHNFTAKQVAGICMTNRQIWTSDKHNVDDVVQHLVNIGGFSNKQIYDLMCNKNVVEDVLTWDEGIVFSATQNLRDFKIQDGVIQKCLCRNPTLFKMDTAALRQIHGSLLEYFTKKDIHQLITESPEVLTEDWAVSFEKLRYICVEMGLNQRDAVFARAFRYDLSHIMSRHLFLERAGLYVKPNPKVPQRKPEITLKQMLSLPDQVFVSNYTSIPVVEYDSFVKLIALELEQQQLADEELDDSDEE